MSLDLFSFAESTAAAPESFTPDPFLIAAAPEGVTCATDNLADHFWYEPHGPLMPLQCVKCGRTTNDREGVDLADAQSVAAALAKQEKRWRACRRVKRSRVWEMPQNERYRMQLRRMAAINDGTNVYEAWRGEIACAICTVQKQYHTRAPFRNSDGTRPFPCKSFEAFRVECEVQHARDVALIAPGKPLDPYYWEGHTIIEVYFHERGDVRLRDDKRAPRWAKSLELHRHPFSYPTWESAFRLIDGHPLKDAHWYVKVCRNEYVPYLFDVETDFFGNTVLHPKEDAIKAETRKWYGHPTSCADDDPDDDDDDMPEACFECGEEHSGPCADPDEDDELADD